MAADYFRMVFDRIQALGMPNEEERKILYDTCRAEVVAMWPDPERQEKELARLEKVIRRQEMQALYEESLVAGSPDGPGNS